MNTWYKNKIVWVLFALLIGGFVLFGMGGEKDDGGGSVEVENESEEMSGHEITVKGVIACLPYIIQITGQECVKGLRGDDGKMYALNASLALPEGMKVTAIGVFHPAVSSVDEASAFKYDGVLEARSLKAR